MKNENESSFDNKINKNIKLFNGIVSEIESIADKKSTMSDAINLTNKAFKIYSIGNNSVISCAVEDAKNKDDDNKALDKFLQGIGEANLLHQQDLFEENPMKEDYQSLKNAVYNTRVLGVGKNNLQKAATIAKIPGRIALGIVGSALGITGSALKLAGNLVKLAPVAGFIIDRIPGLSYGVEDRVAGRNVRHNALQALGEGLEAVTKELQKKSMPVHSTKNKILEKFTKGPSR
jgi:hypothetical protein